jgi:hypothetical protein
MGLLYGRAGRLTVPFGGFRPGQCWSHSKDIEYMGYTVRSPPRDLDSPGTVVGALGPKKYFATVNNYDNSAWGSESGAQVRSAAWRYTEWLAWDGGALCPRAPAGRASPWTLKSF